MAADETRANLERVLAALTAGEQDQPAAPPSDCAAPARAERSDAPQDNPATLLYQAKIDIKQRCLAGAEVLMRQNGDAGGALMPLGASGQRGDDEIARLIEQALVTTLRDWTIFEEAGFNLRASINVPVHLLDRLPIADIVAQHRPKAESWPGLIVEVAEDQIARDISRSVAIAEKLRGSGIAIAIDDFGAGYSSFASLRELAFAELKLNSSFVRGCAGDPTNAAICQTAIDLAHRFGSAAVAEGIETVADLQAMQIMGCDLAQGALIAPPLTRDDFLALLRQRMNKGRPPGPARAAEEPPAAASA
ncbi:MAG TPA: EAL domain-containing protein [Xanthobacteraceae bacterium]|nr:EAL domain-containing protein [Xanthobacteraceae bacterium]